MRRRGTRRALGTSHCLACEQPTAIATTLGFLTDGGLVGEVEGLACSADACRHLREAPGAEPAVFGRVDLRGQRAWDFFLDKLTAAGCRPSLRRPGEA